MSHWQSREKRLAPYVQAAGPLILLGAAPAIWFGGRFGSVVLALVPLILVVRRALHLPIASRGAGGLLVAGALLTGVTAVAVRDWDTASPKLFGVLLGLSLVYVIGLDTDSMARLRPLWLGLAVGMTSLIAFTALFLTEWPQRKLLPLDDFYAMLPAGPRLVDHGGRTGGIGPNQVGGALALLAPLGLALSLDTTGPSRMARQAAAVVLGLAIFVLVLTQSRSAYVGALVGMAFVGWWRLRHAAWLLQRRVRRPMLHLTLGLGLALLIAAIAGTWLAPLDSTTDTLTSRLRIWTASLSLIGDHLYSGVGPGQTPLVLKSAFPDLTAAVALHIPHAHNLVLQALLDLGLPGSVVLGLLITLAVRGLFVTARISTDSSRQLLAVGLAGSLLAFLVYGLTDAIAPGARGGLPFWLVLGLALACGCLPGQCRAVE